MDASPFDADRRAADEVGASDLAAIARGGVLNMVGAIGNGLLSFALVVVVTRGLGAAGVGAFFSAVALFNILSNVAQLGADTGLVRIIAWYRALGRSADVRPTLVVAIVPVVAGGSVFATAMFLFAPQLADLVGKGARHDDIASYARVLAPFLPLTAAYLVALAATRKSDQSIGIQSPLPKLLETLAVANGSRCFGRHDDHRLMRPMAHLVAHAAQHTILEASVTMGSDNDEIGVLSVGHRHERGGS